MRELTASFRRPPEGERVGDVNDADPVRLTVVLRPGQPIRPAAHAEGQALDHAEYQARHGTSDAVLRQVQDYATSHGLRVTEASSAKHAVRLEGTLGQARAAFRPDSLGMWRVGGEDVVAREGHLSIPDALADEVVAVLGFDDRPIARPHFRIGAAAAAGWAPAEVARRYRFPAGLDGAGQTIALVELGGGYDPADIASYFAAQRVARSGRLIAVGVDGVNNAPEGNPDGSDGEVQLDIQVAGSVAPAADIVVYFGSNKSVGFLDTLQAAIDDRTHLPSVVSISWGAPETVFSRQDMQAMDQAMQSAAAMGITVCCASGDNGAGDGVGDGRLHVDFPSSSPHALGCGGTRLPRAGPEVAWNGGAQGGASGGGFSSVFSKPEWQAAISGTQRGVPDVAGDADPATGYQVRVDGVAAVVGGTSAVAPLWAGLIALCNQSLGRRVGFVNPTLYRTATAFNDITAGDNGGFSAAPGWDAVTGLGSPDGGAVLAAFSQQMLNS